MLIVSSIVLGVAVVVAAGGLMAYCKALREREQERRVPRRSNELEARITTVLTGPRQKYGDLFRDYSVWKNDSETRLELVAGDPWKRLNEFTRSLIVRYLWRVLESLAGGAVVIVDDPRQVWNQDVDSGFRDEGFDWKTLSHGPQYVRDP
jgi:hypothetical protein